MESKEQWEIEQREIESKKATSFWYADWAFPIIVALMGAAAAFGAGFLFARIYWKALLLGYWI